MHEWKLEKTQPLQYLLNILNAAVPSSKIFHAYGSFGDVYIQASVIKEIASEGRPVSILTEPKYQKLFSLIPSLNSKILLVDSFRT
jgi:hypothetical protein